MLKKQTLFKSSGFMCLKHFFLISRKKRLVTMKKSRSENKEPTCAIKSVLISE